MDANNQEGFPISRKSLKSPFKEKIIEAIQGPKLKVQVNIEPSKLRPDTPRDRLEELARDKVANDYWLNKRVRPELEYYKHVAVYDTMTQLKRPDLLRPELYKLIGKYQKGEINEIAILSLDLDYFSHFNDAFHSHLFGNEGLRAFAEIVRENLRQDDEAYRTGGEEFDIVLSDLRYSEGYDDELLRQRMEHFRNAVSTELLDKMVQNIKDQNNLIINSDYGDKDDKTYKERMGTIVLREFINNLIELKETNKIKKSMRQMKGSPEAKDLIINTVKNINKEDIETFRKYDEDKVPWEKLTEEEKGLRVIVEDKILNLIKTMFVNRTCSGGLLIIDQREKGRYKNPHDILHAVDSMMYDAKMQGRNMIIVERNPPEREKKKSTRKRKK